MPLLHSSAAPLFYTVTGDGPPLMLLHGYCADHRVWEAMLPALAKRYTVITPDLPGCGQSAVQSEQTIQSMAAALVVLLDALKIKRLPVVGHSMGGYTALALLQAYPERLSALGLLHSHPFGNLTEEEKNNRERSIAFMERYGAALYVKQLIPTLFAPGYADRVELEKQSFRALETPTAGIIACQRAMLHRANHTETLRHCAIPVGQLHGQSDALITTETQEKMSILAPNTTVHWLPHVGHCGMLEEPKTTGRLLRNFLASVV